ncbi:MAG: hypothetical protein AABY22_03380 [Nanoarchaeota archaeon]
MNIIEAIQHAEQGKLITNNFLKSIDDFLIYISGGVFYRYAIVNGKPEYKYEVREFSMAEILSTGWEVLEKNYFEVDLLPATDVDSSKGILLFDKKK